MEEHRTWQTRPDAGVAGPRDGDGPGERGGGPVDASSAPGDVVKLGFVTKFPVDFFFTLENAAKAWDEAHPEAEVLFAQGQAATDDAGQIAAIEDLVAQGVAGHRRHPHERRGHPGARRGHRGRRDDRAHGQRPAEPGPGKSSVVATDNLAGGVLAGEWLAGVLKAGDTLADPRGRARGRRARRSRRWHAPGPGRSRRPRSRSSSGCRPAAPRTRARRPPRTS